MSNLIKHAEEEFKRAGYIPLHEEQEDGPNAWIQENVIELLKVFSEQGHSGFSAPYCINLFAKLAKFELLTPLTGEDDEWNDVTSHVMDQTPTWQNKRCHSVFKTEEGAYDIDGIVFRQPNGCCYTTAKSRVPVTFPYMPKKVYVDVDEEGNEIVKEQA